MNSEQQKILWTTLQQAAVRAWDMWGDDLPKLVEGLHALGSIGMLENELREQVLTLLVRLALSRNKLDPRTLAFLAEVGGSSAARNRVFDALIASSPERDEK